MNGITWVLVAQVGDQFEGHLHQKSRLLRITWDAVSCTTHEHANIIDTFSSYGQTGIPNAKTLFMKPLQYCGRHGTNVQNVSSILRFMAATSRRLPIEQTPQP